MKFKDVAHYYIGCKIGSITEDSFVTMLGIEWNSELPIIGADGYNYQYSEIYPALFPLSAMTAEQKRYYTLGKYLLPNDFKYLLDNHFDLFDLIESGEAIDATTLTPNPYDK